jgi:cobalt/nickel transport protein
MKSLSTNWLLLLAVVGLVAFPLAFVRGGEFTGSDGQATEAIQEAQPDYQPWATPIFKPPSPEIESLLFSVQAGLGAGVVGYAIGWYRGRMEGRKTQDSERKER